MTIAVDQASLGTAFADPSTTTIALTTTAAVAAGAQINLVAGWFNAVTISGASGGALTWTVDKQGHPTTPALSNSAVVRAPAPAGLASGTTITITFSGGAVARNIAGTSFTGVATSSPVDGTPPATTGGVTTTAWASSSATILAGSMLIAGAYNETNDFNNTPTSPSVQDVIVHNTASGVSSVTCHRIEASAGTYTVAGTWSGTANTAINVVGYLAAAGGGGTTVKQLAALGVG